MVQIKEVCDDIQHTSTTVMPDREVSREYFPQAYLVQKNAKDKPLQMAAVLYSSTPQHSTWCSLSQNIILKKLTL